MAQASPCSASAAGRRSSTSRSAARSTRTSPPRCPRRSTTATGRSTSRTATTSIVPRHAGSRASTPACRARQDQLDPPPGGQGPRQRLVVEAWSDPDGIVEAIRWTGPELRGRRAMASRVPRPRRSRRSSTTRPSSTSSSRRRRGARPRHTRSESGAPMKIVNPATGDVDRRRRRRQRRRGRARKYRRRARRPARVGAACRSRSGSRPSRRFRERIVAMHETLARMLTSEVGKPITQSRNELNGLLPRIDFFLEARRERAARREGASPTPGRSSRSGSRTSRSAWSPTSRRGTTRTSSAPTSSCPALLTGNAVLYKPSEFATLTGLAHRRAAARGGRARATCSSRSSATARRARRCSRQPVDGVFFTGSYATGAKIAEAVARQA